MVMNYEMGLEVSKGEEERVKCVMSCEHVLCLCLVYVFRAGLIYIYFCYRNL